MSRPTPLSVSLWGIISAKGCGLSTPSRGRWTICLSSAKMFAPTTRIPAAINFSPHPERSISSSVRGQTTRAFDLSVRCAALSMISNGSAEPREFDRPSLDPPDPLQQLERPPS